MPRGVYVRSKSKVGRKRTFATPRGPVKVVTKARAVKAKVRGQTRVSAKNVVTARFEELMPVLQDVSKQMKLVISTLQVLLEVQKATFLDGFATVGQAQGATPNTFLNAFKNTARLLGITEAYLSQAAGQEAPAPVQPEEPAVPAEGTPLSENEALLNVL